MKRDRAGADGFSLVEVLIVSVMAAGICLVLASVIRMNLRGWQARENQMAVSYELRRGIHAMARELARTRSDQLEVPGVGAMPANGNFYNSLRFRIPQDVDGNGSVLDGAGAVEWSPNQITYALGGSGGLEVRRTQGAAGSTLAYGVTGLRFRRQAATPLVVEMSLTVQKGAVSGGFVQQADLSTRIRLRN